MHYALIRFHNHFGLGSLILQYISVFLLYLVSFSVAIYAIYCPYFVNDNTVLLATGCVRVGPA